MKIEKANRGDKGKYELTLKNSKGEIKIPIEIEVIDKPSAPEGPLKVSDVTNQTAVLSWQPPKDDGGSPIENYIIEKMDVARGEWAPVDTVGGNVTQTKIGKLTPNKEYKFRVRAVNKEGESPNLETREKILAKNPFDEPSKPGTPEILDWDSVIKIKIEKIFFSNRKINEFFFSFFRIESNCHGKRPNLMVVQRLRNMLLKNAKKEKDHGKRYIIFIDRYILILN